MDATADRFFLPDFIRCPCCKMPMAYYGGSIFCTGEKKHCFDVAKEGYVNLLPPGRKKNARTGDGPEMIRARREFLCGGYFDRYSYEAASMAASVIKEKIAESSVSDDAPFVMIDAGCGEGRNTVNMARTLREKLSVPVTAAGFDASKYGAASAAKAYVKHHTVDGVDLFFAAANIFSMPVTDGCADMLCSLFAPLPAGDCARVLKADGVLLVCSAGTKHLAELREILYDYPSPVGHGAVIPDGFCVLEEHVSEYRVNLENSEIIWRLFTMTPFYHNAPESGRIRLKGQTSLDVTIQVHCTAAQRL